ncbi:MAG: winged helix-turn-helix domain-containing protein [Sediminibacterium sp.]|uniref:winged helix-turn-helix domain-containing protein n=1 Tax=Sediminibacterium sp. TaxID=1917865 RepID=UPI00271B1DC3|nr:winged helix-turn-helix domain-containing protein [Sediminibacterium sp.]MDO8997846.1 winged helix-turn-helix domain-containing protein [Sediminibacterium sp.]
MPLQKYLQKISYLHSLIQRKGTGCQKEFAKKANMSRSMLNEYLKEMKELGFPICYSKERNSYYYTENIKFRDSLFDYEIDPDELKGIKGGSMHIFELKVLNSFLGYD